MSTTNIMGRNENKMTIISIAKEVLFSDMEDKSAESKISELERIHKILTKLDYLIDRDYDILFGNNRDG